MTDGLRLVVLAHPRSGSNSLVEIIDRHPELSILNEPFNERHVTWAEGNSDYVGRLRAGESFDAVVDEIFASWSGIKVLSYQLDDEALASLVQRPHVRVIALRRRNVLQAALSQVIAERTELWKTWSAVGPLEDHYRDLEPLDLALIDERMRWTVNEVERIDRATAATDVARVMQVSYEDVFLAEHSRQEAWLSGLWSFLGLPPCKDPEIWHYLSDSVRQARPTTYGQVPNLAEIEERFGNDATGHLEDWITPSR